jgi:uncharacterized protein (DUF58 family)
VNKTWWLLIVLIFIISGLIRYNLLLLVGLLLALIGGASHLWRRYCLAGVNYERRFGATRLFYGEETDLYLEFVNAKPVPLAWLIAVDEFPSAIDLLTGTLYNSGDPRRRLLINSLSLRWYERVTRRYRLRSTRRGIWQFGPVQLSSGDIFGFSIKRNVLAEMQTVVVYPKIVPITRLGLPDLHPFGDFKTSRRVLEDPLRLMGARDYVPGDNFRHIHWKATAHRRDLQTKVFEPSASRPLAIFLNARTAEYANEGIDRDILEFSVSAAASIAHWGWEGGHPVGLYVNTVLRSSRAHIHIQPRNDPHQLNQILEALAWMEDDGQWTLSTLLKREAHKLLYGTSVVAITSLLSNRLLRTLVELRRREYGVTLVVLGQAQLDRDLPGIRYYHLGDREVWHALENLELA